MNKLDAFTMYRNIQQATDKSADTTFFYRKAIKYLESSDYTPEFARKLIETTYATLMVRIALETIPDKTERAVFYIENGIECEVAKTIEEAILPLLEK